MTPSGVQEGFALSPSAVFVTGSPSSLFLGVVPECDGSDIYLGGPVLCYIVIMTGGEFLMAKLGHQKLAEMIS